MANITPQELQVFIKYVCELSGIILDDGKGYLLESRLGPVLKERQCANFIELYHQAKSDRSNTIARSIIDAITTNETSFFRDSAPFQLFKYKLVPEHFDRVKQVSNGRPLALNIWSAACSSGQEIYSIAITLKELLGDLTPYRINIVGTDISDAMVQQASAGCYNKVEIERGLSPDQIREYFIPTGSSWCIKDELRALASFRRLNLLERSVGLEIFDIIFCRNVAIYFSPEDRARLFDRLANQLNPGGVLIIGSTESLLGVTQRYERKSYQSTVFYQRR